MASPAPVGRSFSDAGPAPKCVAARVLAGPSPDTTVPDESSTWRDGMPVLVLGDCTLREARLADAPSLFEQLATDQVARFMSKPPDNPQGFERFIAWAQAERRSGRCFCYGIVPNGYDAAVGLIQVRQLESGFGTAEWGFALGQRFWGSGLFAPAAEAVVDLVFRHAGAYRLEARATTLNGRGNGVLRKLGATLEGVLRQSLVGGSTARDQYLWSLLATDWLRDHPAPLFAVRTPELRYPEVHGLPGESKPPSTPAWAKRLTPLEGPGCTLRELRESDAPELLRQLATAEVCRYLPPAPDSVEAFKRFIAWAIAQRMAGKYICLAMVPPGKRDAVGMFQVRRTEPSFKTAEWGFVLGQEYWGSGIYLAGASLALDFVFDVVGVHRLEARAPTDNGRGNGALRKVGATEEGRLRQSFLLAGVYHDDALWALLADDWRRERDRIRPR